MTMSNPETFEGTVARLKKEARDRINELPEDHPEVAELRKKIEELALVEVWWEDDDLPPRPQDNLKSNK